MRKVFTHIGAMLGLLWIVVGIVVHQMAVEPLPAYVIGSLAALGAPMIAVAFRGFDN
jgi:hypothetical protein